MSTPTIIILVLALILLTLTFNQAVRLRNLVREGWSDIDVQLKKRHDLVPRLVECTKGYQKHERETLESTVQARHMASTAKPSPELVNTEETLNRALVSVMAIAENYPQLKADQIFAELMNALIAVEENLEMARRYYSGAVRNYNTFIESFPQNLFIKLCGFSRADFFEVSSVLERLNPQVKL